MCVFADFRRPIIRLVARSAEKVNADQQRQTHSDGDDEEEEEEVEKMRLCKREISDLFNCCHIFYAFNVPCLLHVCIRRLPYEAFAVVCSVSPDATTIATTTYKQTSNAHAILWALVIRCRAKK